MPFIGNIGPLELLLVLLLALIILGPGKLPEVGSALGRTIREFRKAQTEVSGAVEPSTQAAATTPATPATPPEPAAAQQSTEARETPPAAS